MAGTFTSVPGHRPPKPPISIPGFPPKHVCPPGHHTHRNREQEFVDSKIANESYARMGQKTMIGFFTLKNGYEFVTSYSCANKKNFDSEVAQEQCRKKASIQIWELFSFSFQEGQYGIDDNHIDTGDIPVSNLKSPEQIVSEEEARDILEQNVETANTLVEAEYTPETWAPLVEALTLAKNVLASYNATAEQIDTVNEGLVDAMVALLPVDSGMTESEMYFES